MDGIIFLLIIGGITALVVWRKKVKKAAQEKLFAEQWEFLRQLESKLDGLLEEWPQLRQEIEAEFAHVHMHLSEIGDLKKEHQQ